MRYEIPEVRFFRHVNKTETCWLWTGYTRRYGYFNNGQYIEVAHRYSYKLHKSDIPDGMYVCHACDNPACVNPDHLFLGTQKDNMRDMHSKGRGNPPRGLRNHKARLTDTQVQQIKNDPRIYREIAADFDTSIATVGKIKNNQTRISTCE